MGKLFSGAAYFRGALLEAVNAGRLHGGKFVAYPGCRLILAHGSSVEIGGRFVLGGNCVKRNGRSTILRVDEGASLSVCDTSVYYGADIVLFRGARLEIGNSFINSDARIRVHEHVRIGNGCAISHGFVLMDGNAHEIDGRRTVASVEIGDHVWVGSNVMVLPGVTIGDGAVIGAGAVVTRDVPARSLAAGVPARVIRENVIWRE